MHRSYVAQLFDWWLSGPSTLRPQPLLSLRHRRHRRGAPASVSGCVSKATEGVEKVDVVWCGGGVVWRCVVRCGKVWCGVSHVWWCEGRHGVVVW